MKCRRGGLRGRQLTGRRDTPQAGLMLGAMTQVDLVDFLCFIALDSDR